MGVRYKKHKVRLVSDPTTRASRVKLNPALARYKYDWQPSCGQLRPRAAGMKLLLLAATVSLLAAAAPTASKGAGQQPGNSRVGRITGVLSWIAQHFGLYSVGCLSV